MVLDTKRVVIELERREIVPVQDAAGTQVECLRGRIWITEHRSPGDIVLDAGESYEITHGGVAVVQALREALVALRAPVPFPATPRLAAWAEGLWSRWPAQLREPRSSQHLVAPGERPKRIKQRYAVAM